MKKTGFMCLVIFSTLFSIVKAQKPIEKIQKSITPPNCVKIDEAFFMDQAEITNLQYLEYLGYLKKNQPELYDKNLPDTTVWAALFTINDSYVANYLRYPGFHHFPVVGVSYQQALDFCAWRSKIVTEHFAKNKRNKFQNYQVEFVFKLPTVVQWEKAAQSTSNDPYGFMPLKPKQAKKYQYRANYNHEKTDKKNSNLTGQLITSYVLAFPPNTFGLYNMIGNVAEMTAQEGIAKGGSWEDSLEDCAIQTSKSYEAPTCSLGFRCICEVKITLMN